MQSILVLSFPVSVIGTSHSQVIYRHAAQLCEVELEILLDRYRFDSEEGNTTAARIIMESGYSKTEKRVLLVELLMTESSVEDLVQLLKRRKRGDLAKKIIADYDSFRRASKFNTLPIVSNRASHLLPPHH